jgi:hypothetical protein
LLWSILVSVILIDIFSTRRFYHVLATYANPLGGTGWHRARLIDLAIQDVGQWWLSGYSYDPGWGPQLGMTWTDVTNQFVGVCVSRGLFGLIAFLGILTSAMIGIIKTYRLSSNRDHKKWLWAMGSSLTVLLIAFNTLTLFHQIMALFYFLLGLTCSSKQVYLES